MEAWGAGPEDPLQRFGDPWRVRPGRLDPHFPASLRLQAEHSLTASPPHAPPPTPLPGAHPSQLGPPSTQETMSGPGSIHCGSFLLLPVTLARLQAPPNRLQTNLRICCTQAPPASCYWPGRSAGSAAHWPLGPPGQRTEGQAGGWGTGPVTSTDADPCWALRAPGRGATALSLGLPVLQSGRWAPPVAHWAEHPQRVAFPQALLCPPASHACSHQGQSLCGKEGQRRFWKADLDGSHVNRRSQDFGVRYPRDP